MTIPYNPPYSSIIEYIKENWNFYKHTNPNIISGMDTGKEKDYYIYKLKSDLQIPPLEEAGIFIELDLKNKIFLFLRKTLNLVIFVYYPKLSALAEYLNKS